ncbi:hypothetical protein AVEN_55087-1 [Araneus ventricosus]|uniref:Uncharacterized protein n=1 Tax=Araneus ventricosus TaxID=182803 RepID=A0A4Y2TVE9_ARAVE|nr:hypothetical protein AVEN_55087-1 [Araneus ventricosus]
MLIKTFKLNQDQLEAEQEHRTGIRALLTHKDSPYLAQAGVYPPARSPRKLALLHATLNWYLCKKGNFTRRVFSSVVKNFKVKKYSIPTYKFEEWNKHALP